MQKQAASPKWPPEGEGCHRGFYERCLKSVLFEGGEQFTAKVASEVSAQTHWEPGLGNSRQHC